MKRRTFAMLALGAGAGLVASCREDATYMDDPGPIMTGEVLFTGTFKGYSGHEVSGGVKIVAAEGKLYITMEEDFSLDWAPEPVVGLGRDGYEEETKSGPLKTKSGASSYPLLEGVDPDKYNEVHVWCQKYGVPLGIAVITPKSSP